MVITCIKMSLEHSLQHRSAPASTHVAALPMDLMPRWPLTPPYPTCVLPPPLHTPTHTTTTAPGPPQLMMSFTADGQLDLEALEARDKDCGCDTQKVGGSCV
jgi:hypothetical protein